MRLFHRIASLLVVLALIGLTGCGGGSGLSGGSKMGKVEVTINKPSGEKLTRAYQDIKTVTVTVTGPEISVPVVVDLEFNSNTQSWGKTFDVPYGIDRLFVVVAKDGAGNPLYSGQATDDVPATGVTTITIDLYENTSLGTISLHVTINNAYSGIGKIPVAVGFYTKPGQNPNYQTVIPESQIASLVGIMVPFVSRYRTYDSRFGNEYEVKYGNLNNVPVDLGVSLGRNLADNDAEVAAAIAIIKQGGQVASVVVSNEALLRGDLTEDQIIGYIDTIRSQVNVPITVADTWNVWWNNGNGRPNLAAKVDYIMIHCWPYWESVAIEQAFDNVKNNYAKVTAVYPGKTVVIGETGWPSSGNSNGAAVPSEVGQRRFTRQIMEWSKETGVMVYFFEFFDEPWKNEPNGVGPHWGGFFSDQGTNALQEKPEIRKIWF